MLIRSSDLCVSIAVCMYSKGDLYMYKYGCMYHAYPLVASENGRRSLIAILAVLVSGTLETIT